MTDAQGDAPSGAAPSDEPQAGPSGAAAYPPPPPGTAPYGWVPPAGQPVVLAPRQPKTSVPAIIAMVLAALSFLYCPVVFAVAALVLASSAEREIDASGGWVTGEGLVTGAKVTAWLNIGLAAAAVLAFLVLLAVGALSSPR